MENNGTAGVEQLAPNLVDSFLPEEKINESTSKQMSLLQDVIDSPQTQMILRNAILSLLETPERDCCSKKIYAMLTDDKFRSDVVSELSKETPQYWSDQWNALWTKDGDPLYSKRQQRLTRRISLLSFWTKEWEKIPEDRKDHVIGFLKKITAGK